MASGFHRPNRGGYPRGQGASRGRSGWRGGRGGRGRRPNHGGGQSSGNVVFGFNALQKLREKDPDDIVLDLASDRCLPGFQALLDKGDMSNDMVELVMEILARCCDSNSPHYFNKLLVQIPKSMFVILILKGYITRLNMQRGHDSSPQLFIERTVKLFSEILRRIPSAIISLPLGDLEQVVDNMVRYGQINGEVVQNVEQLKVIKEESLEKERRRLELETQRKSKGRNSERGSVGPPPEDFREMTIIPQYNDIYADKEPYLRKNIVEGRYDDLDHYLDVQFRLLREDFLRPLREGILNLVSHGIDEKHGVFQDIRVYRNVKILFPECSNSGLRHHIEFDNSRLKRVRWENSKRLIFGSLLCLSKDNFQTFVFATVANRDPKELTHGKVTVQFMDSTFDIQDFSRKNVYQMVETTAYFEAYNPILTGLQQTEADDLPFQRYLVECNKDIQPPRYLQRNRFAAATPSFDFSSIITNHAAPVSAHQAHYLTGRLHRLSLHGSSSSSQFQNVPVLDANHWPSKEQLGLDESQYKALQIALTKEVAVIQGPPGTGKTFLGLKIAKILLNNTEKWIQGEQTMVGRRREVNQTPILVICYTNHALDQFLEGIYDFYGSNENKIVRIGGRSKSEKLKDCNLKSIKQKSSKKAPTYVRRSLYEVYSKLEGVKNKMETSSSVLKKCWQNILYEKTLQRTGVVKLQHYNSLMGRFLSFDGGQPEQGAVVLQWLNLVASEQSMDQEEKVIFGDSEVTFNGEEMVPYESLPLAKVDFSLCVSIKTNQGGNIVSNLPENRLNWTYDSKSLYVDHTGVVKFVSGKNIICESRSRVTDDNWHEIAVVYWADDNRLALYVDKRMECIRDLANLAEDNPEYKLKIGIAPLIALRDQTNFVGSMKKFMYYRSTKYSDMMTGDANVEYEIAFMQEQRKVDDGDDMLNELMKEKAPLADDFDVVDPSKLVTSTGEWQVQDKRRARGRITFEIRKQLQSEDVMTDQEASRVRDVWQLQVKDRWRLYRKWVRDISQQHQNTIASVQAEYDRGIKELQELWNAQNYELLREAHVIGMTTTGAAKYRDLLHRIKPKITIVEEAAEVLESHIVTALTGGCEHLILIGDHKQLRPKPTVFQLGLDYQLDISLFERMVENRMPFACLRAQHRMRPEISIMMRPIYDNLIDHESVLNFEKIKGINKNIFFVNHRETEDALDENRSHSNMHEAKFIGALCEYLVKQGYSPSQITVLTPYTGQLLQLKKFVPNVKDLRVCVVDNFQGEENDIILLSLVRSQNITVKEKRDIRRLIGFLAIDNRICVSLSRAKKGFFCIGNLTLMRSANDLWSKILDDMEKRGCVADALPLACQNHPTTITHVSNAIDFNKAPNGGCSILCHARLSCGHSCDQICHPLDPLHEEYKCRKRCAKTCSRGHPCQRRCYQDCNKCTVTVGKIVPRCSHLNNMPCHQEPSTFQCTEPCPKKLSCGHDCANKCGESCTTKCRKVVQKTWSPCGHLLKTMCYVDPAATECPHPCRSLLKCEHTCSGTCGGCKQGRLHQPCSSRCGRIRFCDHECKVPCTKNCPPCPETCPNRCPHSKCVNKCGDPCKECNEPCKWICKHLKCTKKCGELCNRPRCSSPCIKRLKTCGHPCAGLCGEPCPKKCLVCNKAELTEIMFGYEEEEDARFLELADCGHVFEVKGMDQYMDTKEKELRKGESTSIQMIKCPRCKKAIRTSLRYGNIIKTILRDFEDVKKTMSSGSNATRTTFLTKVTQDIASANIKSEFSQEVFDIEEIIKTTYRRLTKDQQNVIENQVQFLKFMKKLKAILKQAEPTENRHAFLRMHSSGLSSSTDEQEIRVMKQEQEVLLKWVMKKRDRFSEQELEDFNDELFRAWILFSHQALTLDIRKRQIDLSRHESIRLEYVTGVLESGAKLDQKKQQKCQEYLQKVIQRNKALQVRYTTVTEEEKRIIVKAIGLTQGHWFKCPKGHIYCIGECGGATEEGECPECKSKIGGTSHQLLPGNSLAPEMDSARYAAYGETANNMGNWDLDRFRF